MEYPNREAPFRKKKTQLNKEQIYRDRIFQGPLSQNQSKSPLPQTTFRQKISLKHSVQPKNQSLLDKIIQSDHKINSKKIQIVKLPKLPFGRHINYNNEELFVSNHFVELETREKTKDIDDAIKKFRLYEKRYKKSLSSSPNTISLLEKNRKYFVYDTNAGKLIVNKNRVVIDKYEESKKVYDHSRNFSFQVIPDLDYQVTERVSDNSKSINGLVKRLYPSPKLISNRVFDSLGDKFSLLFENEEIVSERK